MSTIHLQQTTSATPEQFLAGLTDFGAGRSKLFGRSAEEYLKVHQRGPTYADVTEGSGGVWERLRYDWSDANRVVMETTDMRFVLLMRRVPNPEICPHYYHFSTLRPGQVSKAAGYATAARERPDPNAVCFTYALLSAALTLFIRAVSRKRRYSGPCWLPCGSWRNCGASPTRAARSSC